MNEMEMFLRTKQGREVAEKQAMRKIVLNDPKAIYEDYFVAVRPECLVVKSFFIPSELPYEFKWTQILSMEFIPQIKDDWTSVKPRGYDDEGRWWATDILRNRERELELYNMRIETLDTEPSKSGFTIADIIKFRKACRPYLSFNCQIIGTVWPE